MKDNSTIIQIPEMDLNDFRPGYSGFYITGLNELSEDDNRIFKSLHRISCYQIFLIGSGSGLLKIDLCDYNLKSRTLFSVPKEIVSAVEFEFIDEGYLMFFTEEYLCRRVEDVEWLNNLKLFGYLNDDRCLELQDIYFRELSVLMKKIKTEFDMDIDFVKDDILVNLVKTFLLVSERLVRIKSNDKSIDAGDTSVLVKFKKKLEENFFSPHTVKYYADNLCITSKKLNQVTNKFWGKTAKRVIEERVMLEAKRLLVHSNHTIKEIGSSLGFSDPTNFNKYFKKHQRHTPAEFRESNKKNNFYR